MPPHPTPQLKSGQAHLAQQRAELSAVEQADAATRVRCLLCWPCRRRLLSCAALWLEQQRAGLLEVDKVDAITSACMCACVWVCTAGKSSGIVTP